MSKQEWMRNIFHSSPPSEPDLRGKRARHPRSGNAMKHSTSRHRDLRIGTLNWQGKEQPFGQGGVFPPHVNAGQITEIERYVLQQYQRYKRGQPSRICSINCAGGAERLVVTLGKFGMGKVGAFVRNGSICTVFPEDD